MDNLGAQMTRQLLGQSSIMNIIIVSLDVWPEWSEDPWFNEPWTDIADLPGEMTWLQHSLK